MKFLKFFFTCFILSIIVICLYAYKLEQGDVNVISMYLVAFIVPAALLALLNGVMLVFLSRTKMVLGLRITSLFPAVFLATLAILENLNVIKVQNEVLFVSTFGLFSTGATNLMWNLKLLY